MTTKLTEDGQKLADALRQARVLHSWNHVSTAALNTAAALLFTPPEGEGAGLREAVEDAIRGAVYTQTPDPFEVRGVEEAATAVLALLPALASPQPAVQGPVAAGVDREREIEELAEHLHEERGYDKCATWPTHPDDDGYRGNGRRVTITPPDVQARLREEAGRILIRVNQSRNRLAALTPADPKTPDAGVGATPQEAIDNIPEDARMLHALFGGTLVVKTRLAQPAPAGEDETGVREAVKVVGVSRMFDNDRAVLISLQDRPSDDQLRAIHEGLKSLTCQPPKAETPAGVEALFGSDEYVPDLASAVAAEVMGLAWTHAPGDDVDEHCDRYGAVQEIVDRVLQRPEFAALSIAPAARPGDGFVLVPREPNEIMVEIGEEEILVAHQKQAAISVADIYRVMIAAAPAADGGRA